jgi:hypothetical protein
LILISIWLAGCQPEKTASTSLRVELSSTLRYLSPAIQACALQVENTHIILEEKTVDEIGKTGADVSLLWGDVRLPAGMQAYRLGSDRLIFASHKDNPLVRLKISQAVFLVKGGFATWAEALAAYCPACETTGDFKSRSIEAWHYTPGEDISAEIARLAPDSQSTNLRRVWLAPDPQSLAQALSENPAAIGWLPARWLNVNLKEVYLDEVDPSAQVVPVIAAVPGQPQGNKATWLQCLQTSYGN